MITLITGDKNAGKSSYLESWYHCDPRGCGCISRKIYQQDRWLGYDLWLLPGCEQIPFIRLGAYFEMLDDEELIYYNRFAFSPKAFGEAIRRIDAYPDSTSPLWIDEAGKQELTGHGFDALIRKALQSGRELRVVFRQHLFDELVKHYGITDYIRIDIT